MLQDKAPHLFKKPVLKLAGTLFRPEDLLLILLQLRDGKALSIDQGLLSLVVGGNHGEVCLGDLDIIAKHFIEFDFKRSDAGLLYFLSLQAGNPLLCIAGDGAQIIQLRIESRSDEPSVLHPERRVLNKGAADALCYLRQGPEVSRLNADKRAGAAGNRFLHRGNNFKGTSQRDNIAG